MTEAQTAQLLTYLSSHFAITLQEKLAILSSFQECNIEAGAHFLKEGERVTIIGFIELITASIN